MIGASPGIQTRSMISQFIGGIFMIKVLRKAGISSSMLHTAGLTSIGLSIGSWFTSRNLESKPRKNCR